MISFDHALESSSDEESEDELSESNVFINHLRRGFISFDDSSYCEQGILPDLKIYNGKTKEYILFYQHQFS